MDAIGIPHDVPPTYPRVVDANDGKDFTQLLGHTKERIGNLALDLGESDGAWVRVERTSEERLSIAKCLIDAAKAGEVRHAFAECITDKQKDIRELAFSAVMDILRSYNLDAHACWTAWKSDIEAMIRANVFSNLFVLEELERLHPNSAHVLQREFNINKFGRYKTEMLHRQYQHRNTHRPYVLVMYPQDDGDNMAFMATDHMLNELSTELQEQGYLLRVVEAANKIEAGKLLVRCDKRYFGADEEYRPSEERHKIEAAIIGGHGYEDRICFGGKDGMHSLTQNDLVGKGLQQVGQFFVSNPTIILHSCSTGAPGGIGQNIANMLQATVIAPAISSDCRSIRAKVSNGKLTFQVRDSYNAMRIIAPEKR